MGKFDDHDSDGVRSLKRLNSDLSNYYNDRGRCYNITGDRDSALKDFDMSLQLNPNNVHAYLNRGQLLLQRAAFDKALSDFSKVIELSIDEGLVIDAYNYRSMAYEKSGDKDAAAADMKAAVELLQRQRRRDKP
ncbi:MAG: hypothetical protein HQK97_07435 [Nitrospirae bacterium]|nr:hypothetical protein [Nitrospirota bacterium]